MNDRNVEYRTFKYDDLIIIDAHLNGEHVGRAKCPRHGTRLLIGDIIVGEEMPQSCQSLWQRVLSSFVTPRSQRLRRRGIGGGLLKRVLHEADSAGIQEVWGNITHDDLQERPFLPGWYEQHGFEVTEPDSECIKPAARKIVRRRPRLETATSA